MSIIYIIAVLILSAFISGMSYDYLDKQIEQKFGSPRYGNLSMPISILYTFVPFLLFLDYLFVMYIAGIAHDIKLRKLLSTNDNISIHKIDYKEELGLDQFGNMSTIKKCYMDYKYTDKELDRVFGVKSVVLVGDICDNFSKVPKGQVINTTETELSLLRLNKDMENLSNKHKSIVENMIEETPKQALENFSQTLDFTMNREKEKIKVK